MNIVLDIETIPAQPEEQTKAAIRDSIQAPKTMTKSETIDQWHAGEGKYAGVKDAAVEKAYRDTSFDGAAGRVCSIAWNADGVTRSVCSQSRSEAEVLQHFANRIKEACAGRPPFFIGHYIAGFDLKFLFHRFVILGIDPGFSLPFYGRHGKDFYCTQQAWAGFNGKISQDNLCKALGLEGKPDDITGSQVWDFVKAGNIERVQEYNENDVDTVVRIHNRLHFRS